MDFGLPPVSGGGPASLSPSPSSNSHGMSQTKSIDIAGEQFVFVLADYVKECGTSLPSTSPPTRLC
jgi:hypothetical protein